MEDLSIKEPTSESPICRDFLRGVCNPTTRPHCKFHHPSAHELVMFHDFYSNVFRAMGSGSSFELCRDFLRGKCKRAHCKFYHPPPYIMKASPMPFAISNALSSHPQQSQQDLFILVQDQQKRIKELEYRLASVQSMPSMGHGSIPHPPGPTYPSHHQMPPFSGQPSSSMYHSSSFPSIHQQGYSTDPHISSGSAGTPPPPQHHHHHPAGPQDHGYAPMAPPQRSYSSFNVTGSSSSSSSISHGSLPPLSSSSSIPIVSSQVPHTFGGAPHRYRPYSPSHLSPSSHRMSPTHMSPHSSSYSFHSSHGQGHMQPPIGSSPSSFRSIGDGMQ
ncbi:hypothetical protein ADUPG1_013626 [Aduncisulcus paluster]|uniref:C3H1-type domain-containing protein n=1 Tax=Aduncisulcus paluster TaxID=2918883 RepID=A0ABQ5K6U4_9EUKA|nr:hypothetical protein ADUPG1_013626 [Aduncisulcus paluster]